MQIIAHRGLFQGPNAELENSPDQIVKAIDHGFRVEVDLRYIDGAWWLGHDKPQYNVRWEFIYEYCNQLWIHAKDIITLRELVINDLGTKFTQKIRYNFLNYFFHDQDDCALTSIGYIWTFPGKGPLTNRSVAVMPERVAEWDGIEKCFGICTDFAIEYREKFRK